MAVTIPQLALDIDSAVNPTGGEPLITGAALNTLLHEMVDVLAPGATAGAPQLARTHAALLAEQAAGALVPGQQYRLTDRPHAGPGTSGDVLVAAASAQALHPEAVLLARVPDYRLPLWAPTHAAPGPLLGTLSYQATTTPSYARVLPQVTDVLSTVLYGDDNYKVYPLAFGFTFGGITYHEVMVDTNGRVVFGGPYSSVYRSAPMGSSTVPMAALAWTDLMPTSPGTLTIFTTGTAPHRRFVVDYTGTRMQVGIYFNGEAFDGQLILEETTNAVVLGQAYNTLTLPTYQGLQYAGGAYEPYKGQPIPVNSTTSYVPVADRGPATTVAFTATQCVWRGQTWACPSGDPTQEPGTSADWRLATAAGADAFGNTVPVADAITYELATDAVRRRQDAQGNDVDELALATFPWGAPGVRANTLRQTTLDASLLTTPGLTFAHNLLTDCRLSRLGLAGLDFSHNSLYHLVLDDYAPAEFSGITAYYGVAPGYYGANELLVDGAVVQDRTTELGALLTNFKEQYVDNMFTTYRQGQPDSHAGVDIFSPNPRATPAHDLIKVTGYKVGQDSVALRTQSYNLIGDATLDYTRLGFVTYEGLKITINGLNFPKGMSMLGPIGSGATVGHTIFLLKCTISTLEALGSYAGNTPVVSTLTVAHSVIDRYVMNSGSTTRTRFNHCTFGQGTTSGSVLSAVRTADHGPIVFSNCTIYLNGAATLYDPGFNMAYAPTFQNVTLVSPTGAVSRLDTPAPVPAAPAEFTATRTAGTGVRLAWLAPAGASMYQVFSNVGGAGFQLLASVPYPFFDDASASAASAGVGIQYYVVAASASGPGAASATVAVG
jgi:hypothetical protein